MRPALQAVHVYTYDPLAVFPTPHALGPTPLPHVSAESSVNVVPYVVPFVPVQFHVVPCPTLTVAALAPLTVMLAVGCVTVTV